MVGIITQSSSFNSFSSICYCFVAMGIHSYSSYKAVKRQKDAITKAWPGGGGTPSEATLLLGSTIVSLLMMPFFCITCFIKVGNLANDGVKLGRDHALGYMLDATPDINDKHEGLRRVWRHFCPLSQTLHLVAAFLLLIPETLLTAVEVKFGYRSSDASWSSNLNFLYSPDRSILSEIRSSVNMSLYANLTHIMLPTPRVPTAGWNDNTAITTAFMNFCFALACFLVRYSSVFWYTNKVLTVIFALQLLAMTMNSVFSFNTFTVLYCICYNRKLYPNVSLSLSCAMDLFLYLAGGLVLLLSTMTVFEYGAHYFQEKFKIVDNSHHKETSQKHTATFNTGCQGYIPHSCAVASLIILAMCKGPLLYDLVSLMRVTDDQLLLSGIVCEVSYMVTWVALWFGLTIKQQWHFRILDCVPLHAVCGQDIVKYRQQGHVDKVHNDGQSRGRRLSGKDFPGRYNIEVFPPGTASSSEDNYQAGFGIHEPPMFNIINYAAEIVLDLDSNTTSDDNFNFRKSRSRKDGEQRVTFDESAHGKCSFGKDTQHTPTSSLTRQGTVGGYVKDDNHFNVTVDVHNSTPSSTNCSSESSQDITLRQNLNNTDNTEYRNNIRSKCGEFYSSGNNISSNFEEAVMILPSQETVPTLMSSFRDKVRESSLAASSFKERERHMLESFDYTDPLPPPIVEDLQSNDHDNPQCVIDHPGNGTDEFGYPQRSGNTAYAMDKVINDENYTGEFNIDGNSMYGHANSGPDSYSRPNNTNVIYRCEENINHGRYNSTSNDRSSSLPRNKQHTGPSHGSRAHLSSFVSVNAETLGLNPPSVVEDHQLGRASDCVEYHYPPRPQQTVMSGKLKPCMLLHPKIYDWPVLVVMDKRTEIGRRDSANYSLTSSNDSDNCQSLCNQV